MRQDPIQPVETGAAQTRVDTPPAQAPAALAIPSKISPDTRLMPQHGGQNAPASAEAETPTYIYAIGNFRPAYPSISLEMAFNQAVGDSGTNSPDDALQFEIFSKGETLYITRDMCWILQIGCVDTYLVKPRTYLELYSMVTALEPAQTEARKRFDVVIGPRGPLAPPELCPGLQLPLVVCNQLYSFFFDEFVAAVVAATSVRTDDAASMFFELLQVGDNAGETDEHRALNYVILRYPNIYLMAANMLGHSPAGPYSIADQIFTLTGVTAKPAPIQGARRIIDIVFHYRERQTGEMVSWYCQVDVTGQFPFLVRPLSRYYPYV